MSWKASGAAKDIACGAHGEELTMADKLVLMVLSDDFNEDKQYAYPSQDLLAKRCLCTPRGLRGILDRLERFGLIKIVHRGKAGNYYVLLFALRNALPQSFEEQAGASKVEVYEERDAVYEERAGSQELDLEQETPKPEQEKASSERTYEPLAIPKPQKHSKQNLPRFASRAIYRETATPTALASWDAEGFEAFWQAYPKQVGRVRALREWNLMRPPIEEVLAGIAVWKKSSDWKRESGQFIHTPARFLEDQIWKENPEPRIERSLSKHEEREKRNKEVARRAIERSHCRTPTRVRDALAPRPN